MELWNAKQTAKFLGLTYSQLWRIIGDGLPHPPYIKVGARKRFVRSEVERWVAENQVSSPASVSDSGTPA